EAARGVPAAAAHLGRQRLCRATHRLVAAFAGCVLQIVKRSDDIQGFVVQPHRWIVERTFGWLSKYRRLAKDYEETCKSSEAWIRLAMIHLMVRRLQTSA